MWTISRTLRSPFYIYIGIHTYLNFLDCSLKRIVCPSPRPPQQFVLQRFSRLSHQTLARCFVYNQLWALTLLLFRSDTPFYHPLGYVGATRLGISYSLGTTPTWCNAETTHWVSTFMSFINSRAVSDKRLSVSPVN